MIEMIKSKALEVNLSRTKNVPYTIPDEHKWFMELSEKYWGVNKRVTDFFNEYHHPFSNRKEVVNTLVHVTIGDFWLYKEKTPEEQKRIIDIMLGIYRQLLGEKLPDILTKQLVYVFLDFLAANDDVLVQNGNGVSEIIKILDDNFEKNSFSYLSNIGHFKKKLTSAAEAEATAHDTFVFMKKLIGENIRFWKESTQIEKWYEANCAKMSHNYLAKIEPLGISMFNEYETAIHEAASWNDLCANAFTFSDIIDAFKSKIEVFEKASEQFCYIFYLLHLSGTVYHREHLLIELNKVIKRISNELDEDQCIASMDELFAQFVDFKENHINLILDSILTLGKEIINTKNQHLIHYLENKIIQFGFITPGVTYMTNEWELKVNPCHIKNVRVWLELIEYVPETMQRLLSALIINLRIGGIFVFDTDFFQKDITRLLNSKISPIYKQTKQLARIFPVYFNEIGAEGQLRDVSTKIDELSHRNDKLIHFLRKQIHTEGNNSHIQIALDVINFWYDLKQERLFNVLPQNVYELIENQGIWVTGVHDYLHKICETTGKPLEIIIEKSTEELATICAKIEHDNPTDMKRVCLIIELYQLLKEKYIFASTDIINILKRYYFVEQTDIDKLEKCLTDGNNVETLKHIFSIMKKLNNIIFDPKQSTGWENVVYKRHIAFGIPSMYGYYKEEKFDALGLTFRLERIASVLIKNIINEINTNFFTLKTFKEICGVIQLLREGMMLDGIYDQSFDSNLKMLQYSLNSGCFTIGQYINIFQFMGGSMNEIINNYFIRPYEPLLKMIIPQQFVKPISDKHTLKKVIAQKSEVFYRELLSSSFIIQQLDNFMSEILNNLRKQINILTPEESQNLMTYDQKLAISPLYQETPYMDNQVFLGSKAYYLKKLYLNHYSVPPGFVVTTEVFRRINSIVKVEPINAELDKMIRTYLSKIEKITGLKYGDPKKPLLLSVRSGSAISMPGAMNTFLNVGLNDEITEMLSKQDNYAWTSWDCYRRLLQTWGMSHGLDRNDFDQIIINYKKKYNVLQKIDFTPEYMKEIAFAYKQLLIDNHIEFETDPFEQLKKAVLSVFDSWNSPRAIVYRNHMHIANEWGTAAIIQKMVLGNIHRESGSGVVFTRDIKKNRSAISLTGDFSFLSQGEDIVGGLVNTLPISESQRVKEYQNSPFSLETAFPAIFNKLYQTAKRMIETDGFSHQEIEFTFETSAAEDLYILQTRNMAVVHQDNVETFATPHEQMDKVGSGIGIGNRVLNGIIVFDMDDIQQVRNGKEPEQNIVLVRPDTVPDDIELIIECDGLMTARGGATSHAAVTAATLGKTCVVNCDALNVYEKEKRCTINGTPFKVFDPVAIDGRNGLIYKGNYLVIIDEFN
ncbi:MAG TPA: PEP/pyruvate-binding domain-containing protein [Bacteroidales bacterium]|nr:PEP/pyruvate-binding domain-containing protein [Bacteroidales bacterium]HPT51675.1 PEP/pyruvate-binding domain-containing protein [Bacteroidales bacterium]